MSAVPAAALPAAEPRCEELIVYVIHGWTGQPGGKRRSPRDLETYLRCTRVSGHTGEHRHHSIRQWTDSWTSGWIEDADTPP